jgi:hypothetical protein
MPTNRIGVLKESTLHAELKNRYSSSADRLEVPVEGFVIDIVRENLLIEIQTGNFSSLKNKLTALLSSNPLKLVYPIAVQKRIVMLNQDRETILRSRLSPKRGRVEDIFWEMVHIARFALSENFTFEVLFIQEEEIRFPISHYRSWRKTWSVKDRKLVSIAGSQTFRCGQDYLDLLSLDQERFSNHEVAKQLNLPIKLARRMTYSLREMKMLEAVGKKGNALLFSRREA